MLGDDALRASGPMATSELEPAADLAFSVVVCAHNEEDRVLDCLMSLAEQTYPRETYEVIVIDDGSTDGTWARIEAFVDWCAGEARDLLVTAVKIEWGGLSVARNTGLRLAQGSYVAYVDADARVNEEWASELAAYIGTEQPPWVVAGGTIDNLTPSSSFARLIHAAHYQAVMRTQPVKLVGANMVWRRDALEKIGGFEDIFTRRGDETAVVTAATALWGPGAVGHVPAARVANEHPQSFVGWLRIQYYEGRMTSVLEWSDTHRDAARSTARGVGRLVFLFANVGAAVGLARGRRKWLATSLSLALPRLLPKVSYLAEGTRRAGGVQRSGPAVVPWMLLGGIVARDLGWLVATARGDWARRDRHRNTGRIVGRATTGGSSVGPSGGVPR